MLLLTIELFGGLSLGGLLQTEGLLYLGTVALNALLFMLAFLLFPLSLSSVSKKWIYRVESCASLYCPEV
jgi:hypothetical protein